MNTFQTKLLDILGQTGLSDDEVASRVEVSRSTVTRWREGVTEPATRMQEGIIAELTELIKKEVTAQIESDQINFVCPVCNAKPGEYCEEPAAPEEYGPGFHSDRQSVKRICDIPESEIFVGMRIRCHPKSGFYPNLIGTITKIDIQDDRYAWIQWDKDDQAYGGFYGNNCECEVVKE